MYSHCMLYKHLWHVYLIYSHARSDPLFCFALIAFKDLHVAWGEKKKKKHRNFYRIKHCQRIMLSGCFRPIKEPWNIPWKEVIIDPVSITLHFNALVSIMPKYIKISQSFFIYNLAYTSDFIPFQMTSESQKRYCFFLILNSVFNTGIFQT